MLSISIQINMFKLYLWNFVYCMKNTKEFNDKITKFKKKILLTHINKFNLLLFLEIINHLSYLNAILKIEVSILYVVNKV
jgi:hypothetical protein